MGRGRPQTQAQTPQLRQDPSPNVPKLPPGALRSLHASPGAAPGTPTPPRDPQTPPGPSSAPPRDAPSPSRDPRPHPCAGPRWSSCARRGRAPRGRASASRCPRSPCGTSSTRCHCHGRMGGLGGPPGPPTAPPDPPKGSPGCPEQLLPKGGSGRFGGGSRGVTADLGRVPEPPQYHKLLQGFPRMEPGPPAHLSTTNHPKITPQKLQILLKAPNSPTAHPVPPQLSKTACNSPKSPPAPQGPPSSPNPSQLLTAPRNPVLLTWSAP